MRDDSGNEWGTDYNCKSHSRYTPDGIPGIAIKAIIVACADMFRMAMQRGLNQGEFPERYKKQKLVLCYQIPESYLAILRLETPLENCWEWVRECVTDGLYGKERWLRSLGQPVWFSEMTVNSG